MTNRRPQLAELPTIDLATLTLGELEALELESGRSFELLLKAGAGTRRLLALWLYERRQALLSSERPPTWRELGDRPLYDVSS